MISPRPGRLSHHFANHHSQLFFHHSPALAPTPRRAPAAARAEPPAQDDKPSANTFYNDERPLPPRTEMSDAYKKKLRDEYLGLGGSPNTAMGANYFLWIIVGVSVLAVATWLTGAI
jgi:L-ascorbate peroxidase